MMKTMKKGLVRTVAFVVAWTLCWTTISSSLFTSVSYAAEAEEAAPVEEIIEEIPEEEIVEEEIVEEITGETVEEVVEETVEEVVEETTGEVIKETTEEMVEEDEKGELTDEVSEETFTATITYKATEGGSVSLKNESLTWKKITSIDENGEEEVTFEAVSTEVKGSLATADEGYTFINWTKNGKVVSEDETFVPAAAKEDVTYKAEFEVKAVEEKEEAEEKTEEEKDPEEDTAVTEVADEEKAVEEKEEKEEEAKEAKEAKEDKVSYPAASFTGETGDVSVRAHVKEGVFPEGTTMKVSAVSTSEAIAAAQDMVGEGTEVVDAIAVDITFHHEGEEIQPKGDVSVRLSAKHTIAGDSHEAITIDGSGSASGVAGASAHSASFDTDHFTVYAIYGLKYEDDVEPKGRIIYVYHAGNPEDEMNDWPVVRKDIYAEGDKIELPADPAGDATHQFAGYWYVGDEEGKPVDPEQKVVSGDTVTIPDEAKGKGPNEDDLVQVHVFPKFNQLFKVTFYADENKTDVLMTEIKEDGVSVSMIDADTAKANGLNIPNGKKLVSWKDVAKNETISIDDKVTLDGADIDLVPVYADAHHVSFDLVLTEVFTETIPDQVVENGQKIEDTSGYALNTVYKFYKFGGWYTDGNYHADATSLEEKFTGELVDFNSWVLSDADDPNIVLHAKWIPTALELDVIPFRESQNDPSEYEEQTAEKVKWDAGTEDFLVDVVNAKILGGSFTNVKYRDDKTSLIGRCHLSGNGKLDDQGPSAILVNGEILPAVQVFDKNGAEIAAYNFKGEKVRGADITAAHRDKIGYVRVNYNRDRYYLRFVFEGEIAEGGKQSTKLSAKGKELAKSVGANEDVVFPAADAIIVKNAQHLGKLTHGTYNYGGTFDPFMRVPFYFTRKTAPASDFLETGQAVFDDTNTTWPVKPVESKEDGSTVTIYCQANDIQKDYVYITYYYDNVSSWNEVTPGVNYTSKTEKTIGYASDGKANGYNIGHGHGISLGNISGAYRLVAVTGQRGYRDKIGGKLQAYKDESDPIVWSGSGVQQINVYAKNGYYDGKASEGTPAWETNNNGPVEPVCYHCIPATFTVTFKQTKDGFVNGLPVSDATKQTDAKIEKKSDDTYIYSGDDLSAIMAMAPDWNSLKDTRGVVFTPDGDWICVQDPNLDLKNGKMPAQDLVFYRNWKTDSYTVTIDYNDDEHIEDHEDVAYGSQIPARNAAYLTRPGFTLTGWEFFKRGTDANGKAIPVDGALPDVSFNSIVTQNLYIKAHWTPNKGFRVEYREGDHGTLAGAKDGKITDSMLYRGASAPVNYIPKADENYVFVGYKMVAKDGKATGPDVTTTVAYDESYNHAKAANDPGLIVLEAKYEKKPKNTKVSYHSNYPAESSMNPEVHEVKEVTINKEFSVKSNMFTAPAGYRFLGWTTDASNDRVYEDEAAAETALDVFYPSEMAAAGIAGNHLYALWAKVPPTPPTPPTDIPDDPTPTTPEPETPTPENPITTFIENILGVRRTPETGDDVPAVAGSRRSRVDTNDYSRMEFWMILALGCILIQADMLRKVKKQRG